MDKINLSSYKFSIRRDIVIESWYKIFTFPGTVIPLLFLVFAYQVWEVELMKCVRILNKWIHASYNSARNTPHLKSHVKYYHCCCRLQCCKGVKLEEYMLVRKLSFSTIKTKMRNYIWRSRLWCGFGQWAWCLLMSATNKKKTIKCIASVVMDNEII